MAAVDKQELLSQAKEAFISYLDTYFVERDMTKTSQFFSENITGIGTGQDEIGHSLEKLVSIYERDIKQAPNIIHYDIVDMFASHIEGTVCNVCAILNIKTKILDQELTLNDLRQSVQLYKKNSKWLIAHNHISLPTIEHEGDESYPLKELEERNVVLQRLVDKKTADLASALEEINHIASTDKLTGLSNRNILDKRLEDELTRSSQYGTVFSILLIDVDLFKNINDNYGHIAGDVFLQELSRLLSRNIRGTDIVGRWGGEEFLIICPETDLDNAYLIADKIRTSAEQHHFSVAERQTISVGVSTYTPEDTCDAILHRADLALYASKSNGRNRVSR